MPRNEVKHLSLFLSKIALYARYGYRRYVVRQIPEGKDLSAVDLKILRAYEVTFSRWRRGERKKQGLANVMYLRFGNTFVLLATDGKHEAFDKLDSLHLNERPITFSGYSVGIRNHKPCISMPERRYKAVKKKTTEITLHNHSKVTRWLRSISPMKFRGVNNQRWKLFKQVNKKRKAAGLKPIVWDEVKPY